MSDRELLELAAKAAGHSVRTDLTYEAGIVIDDGIIWNPLADDGDALRLAVKLRIVIDRSEVKPAAFCYCDYKDQATEGFVENHGNDPYAATRRAIVRAAAGIGKGMK